MSVNLASGVVEHSRPERAQLPREPEAVTLKLKNKESEMHLPGQIEEELSVPLTSNALSIKNPTAMQPSNNNSNNSSKKVEATEQKLIYEKCMKFFYYFGYLLGMRTTYEWKPQRYFMFFIMSLALFFVTVSVLYTMYVHYVNDNYMRILEPLAVSGITVSVILNLKYKNIENKMKLLKCWLKLYAFLRNWYRILSLMFAIRKYFRPNVFGRQAEIVQSSLRNTWTFLITYAIGVCLCCVFYVFTPIMVYLTTNEVIPLAPLEIFFCDQSQTSGFVIATIAHFIIGSYSAVATLFNGAVIIFCFRNYILQADLIAEDFQELDGMWNGKNNISVEYRRAFLKNICIKRQDMNNYLNMLKEVYETQFYIYFCSSYFSQIICLYDITQNDWIGGYAAACMLFLEMMFYCYMGTQVSIVDDKLCYSICNNNWYMYDLESQRMVSTLLHESQQSKELQIGVIGPLNMVTGIMIIKSIYSYYTVLTELF